jgi:cysteine synthase B
MHSLVLFVYWLFVVKGVIVITDIRTEKIKIFTKSGLAHTVGNTPLLPLHNLAEHLWPRVQVFAKAEWFNPGGSVKDRPALQIIRTAIETGELDGERRLLDSTSGNMGIAYATLGASFGIPVTLALPANASAERITILRALGAELKLTDPLEGSDGAIQEAHRLAKEHPERYYYANQYDNPANWQAHYLTTGPEIWQQTGGQVSHFIAGLGTSGTITGVTRYLKEKSNNIQCIAAFPDESFHGIEGLRHYSTCTTPAIYDPTLIDSSLSVRTEDAYQMVRTLARKEGLFVGISSGAAAVVAMRVAEGIEQGVVVTVFPDAGYKYLSNHLWEAK